MKCESERIVDREKRLRINCEKRLFFYQIKYQNYAEHVRLHTKDRVTKRVNTLWIIIMYCRRRDIFLGVRS